MTDGHPKLITCICPAPAGQVCPIPHDRWLGMLPAVVPISEPYPCRCDRRGCSPQWCICAGRVDLENVPASCCAHRFTPDYVARAIHGGDYKTCWCKGKIERHKTEAMTRDAERLAKLELARSRGKDKDEED